MSPTRNKCSQVLYNCTHVFRGVSWNYCVMSPHLVGASLRGRPSVCGPEYARPVSRTQPTISPNGSRTRMVLKQLPFPFGWWMQRKPRDGKKLVHSLQHSMLRWPFFLSPALPVCAPTCPPRDPYGFRTTRKMTHHLSDELSAAGFFDDG